MLHVKTPDEALEIIHGAFAPLGRPPEAVPLLSARGRVLARAVTAEAYVPDFCRSTVDGYALRAADTFGCSEALPAQLLLAGQVRMGEGAGLALAPGHCAAIPTELLESELFGYEDGAFTGAKKGGKPGKFQLANGGTLFLDEIGDMPLNMQAKILRALQEREVEPVGGSGPVPVDVRVISATRRNLPELIESGDFREDLYYRLNVINIEMPPLRTRRGDILELANHFLAKLNLEFQRATVLSPEVKRCFAGYQWPGNVRELDNVIKGAYATCDGFTIDMTDLPAKMAAPRGSAPIRAQKHLSELVDDYEREVILAVLRENHGNCQQTADELGIHRSALYKKVAKLGLKDAVQRLHQQLAQD